MLMYGRDHHNTVKLLCKHFFTLYVGPPKAYTYKHVKGSNNPRQMT